MLSQDRIDITWKATRQKAKLKDIMQMFDCSKAMAIELYSLGEKKYGHGPHRSNVVELKEGISVQPTYERPPAVYSNPSFDNY